jgi:hypothetical protein
VEVHQAKDSFEAGGKLYPAGSFVILLGQPYKAYAWALLEKQTYPDLREYVGGPPIPPYDNAGWTLPLQMGVSCDEIKVPFKTNLIKVSEFPRSAPSPLKENPAYFVLDSRNNGSYSAAISLLKEGAEISRSKQEIVFERGQAAAGSFVIKATPQVQRSLPLLLEKWQIRAVALDNAPAGETAKITFPRIGLYQSWRSNMDEGWTRFVFDDLGIPFTTLHNKDLQGTKKEKANLRAKYDVIIFADENADIIKTGKIDPTSEYAMWFTALPPDYEGGIEKEGVEALKAFVEEGGVLVTLNEACNLVFKEFQPPARNLLEKVDRTRFFCPTSILKLRVDTTSPIGYGLAEETAAVFSDGLAFDTWVPTGDWNRKVVASYPEKDVLLSGWLLGEEVIARKAAVVDATYKKGHVILFGIRPQHRAQSHGTYKFLLNALLYPQS